MKNLFILVLIPLALSCSPKKNYDDLGKYLKKEPGTEISITIERDGEKGNIIFNLWTPDNVDNIKMGILFDNIDDKSIDMIFADPPYNLQLRNKLKWSQVSNSLNSVNKIFLKANLVIRRKRISW